MYSTFLLELEIDMDKTILDASAMTIIFLH